MVPAFRVIFLGVIASFFLSGLYNMITSVEENGCEMTYMYQMPEYIVVPLPMEIKEAFPRYGLRVYGEGNYAAQLSQLKPTGIPVLFIPGHAGSYKQVRSLGSVALKMAESRGTNFHFNFFALDLNEEFSGAYGSVLMDQTKFTAACIEHILTLYPKDTNAPKSVVLVGHSMGGLVARAVFTLPGFKMSTVTTIITQATPHQAPVISTDSHMAAFYHKVNDYWINKGNRTLNLVTVFSTGGGFRDHVVRSTLTGINRLFDSNKSHSSLTTAIPRGWRDTDHLCHVWCKQVVMATVRALFDMVDKNKRQMAKGPSYKLKVWRFHFEKNPGPKTFQPSYDEFIKLSNNTKWEIRKKKSWSYARDKITVQRYSIIPLPRLPDHAFAIISSIDSVSWIGLCKVNQLEERCSKLINIAHHANMLPPLHSERKILHVPAEKLLDGAVTHLVIIHPKTRSRAEYMADMYNITRRHIQYTMPNFFTVWNWKGTLPPEVVINQTEPDALFYNITLMDHGSLLDAYTAHLIAEECKDAESLEHAGSVMQFHLPWSLDDVYSFIRYRTSGNISLRLQTPKPAGVWRHAELHLFLHQACRYKVVIDRDWPGVLGQFVRYYWVYLPAFVIVQLFMGLAWQLRCLDEDNVAPSFPAAHARWAQPWRVVPLAFLLHFLLEYPDEAPIGAKIGLPPDDITTLQKRGVWVPALPIFLYLTAHAFTELYSVILHLQLSLVAKLCGCLLRVCCVSVGVLRVCVVLQYISFVTAIALSYWVCGPLGLLVIFIIYIIKTSAHHIWGTETNDSVGDMAWNRFHVNSSLLLLLMASITLQAPALVHWAKNLRYAPVLETDPTRGSCVLLGVAMLLMTLADIPATVTDLYSVSQSALYVSCLILINYATESVHRLPNIIAANLLIIGAPVLLLVILSKFRTEEETATKIQEKKHK